MLRCAWLRVLLLQLFADPVLQRRHLLDIDLLLGVALLRRQVDLILDTVGGQRALILERARGDVVVARALGDEADVDAHDVVRGVPLALEQGRTGDALLCRLHLRNEGSQTIDLDRVALRQELDETALQLLDDTVDDVAAVDAVVAGHVVDEALLGDRLLLLGLRIVLPVTGIVRVRVLAFLRRFSSNCGFFTAISFCKI